MWFLFCVLSWGAVNACFPFLKGLCWMGSLKLLSASLANLCTGMLKPCTQAPTAWNSLQFDIRLWEYKGTSETQFWVYRFIFPTFIFMQIWSFLWIFFPFTKLSKPNSSPEELFRNVLARSLAGYASIQRSWWGGGTQTFCCQCARLNLVLFLTKVLVSSL